MNDEIKPETNQILASALGITVDGEPTLPARCARSEPPMRSNNVIETDADYARTNIYGIIEQGAKAIEDLMDVAKESQHPRAYEVLAQMLKNQAENIDKLLKIQGDKKKLGEPIAGQQSDKPINIEKAVFVGTTMELLDMINTASATKNSVIEMDSEE